MSIRLASAALALALVAPLAACSDSESASFRDVEPFVDGMGMSSDSGAFRVVLSSADGELATGRNDLVLRLGFHDPQNPEAEGRGVPGAEITVDAWMADDAVGMTSAVTLSYLGDGAYALDNLVLEHSGVWNFAFDIRVGTGMHETLSLTFDVDALERR